MKSLSPSLFFFVAVAILSACERRTEQQSSVKADSPAADETVASKTETQSAPVDSIAIKMGYPFTLEWIPGQRDTADFEVLSKFRAHGKRLSPQVLVLTLDTPTGDSHQQGKPSYRVADSTVVTGLSYADFLETDCRTDSLRMNGLIAGLIYPNDRTPRPRLVWQFDTVSLKIRSISPDSISCYHEEVD